MAAAKILKKKQKTYIRKFKCGRDWGDARDYVEGMWKILQYKKPEDFILATGKGYTVRQFTEMVFKNWNTTHMEGKKRKRKRHRFKTGKIIVEINPKYYRPNEVERLIGSNKKQKNY